MPRLARIVFAGIPHHITQRGNRRADVFFDNADRARYLKLLKEYALIHEVEILAYCLMRDHVHIIAVPRLSDGLQRVLKPLHMRYAQAINRRHGWSGHLWQGRFFSRPLDDEYLWFCVRYVERNSVRAGIVERAEDYLWSSAAVRCGLRSDAMITANSTHWAVFEHITNWSAWLAEEEESRRLEIVRRNIHQNLPCRSGTFVEHLERISQRSLHFRPVGRPPNSEKG